MLQVKGLSGAEAELASLKLSNLALYIRNVMRIENQVDIVIEGQSSECYTTLRPPYSIHLGWDILKERGLTLIDAFLHEVLHNVLPDMKEYRSYSYKMINVAQDLEINSILGLSDPSMDVLYPSKLGLPVGLTTLEYLQILYPNITYIGESGYSKEAGDGGAKQDIDNNCGHDHELTDEDRAWEPPKKAKKTKFNDKGAKSWGEITLEKIKKATTDKFEFEPLRDLDVINFLEEAKIKSTIKTPAYSNEYTYKKFSRRSRSADLIFPGIKKSKNDGYKAGTMPLLLVDTSLSINTPVKTRLVKSIMGWTHPSFIILTYGGLPQELFYPKDKIFLEYSYGTDNFKAVSFAISHFKDDISEIFTITDGEDDTIEDSRALALSLGLQYSALFIKENGKSQRI